MKNKVLIFGGTTEGRVLSDTLRKAGVPHEVSVATEYGRQIELGSGEKDILTGRLSKEKIAELLNSGEYGVVVDATHPFAIKASAEIKGACKEAGKEYLRLSRDTSHGAFEKDAITYVDNMREAGQTLKSISGNILLLTGSKDLAEIVPEIGDNGRVYVRVLPSIDSISLCEKAGLSGKHIIAMQGPFSAAMNKALIKELDARVILTKESGVTGGYYEKLEAADDCGTKVVVVRNPESHGKSEEEIQEHLSMEEVLSRLGEIYGLTFDCCNAETDIDNREKSSDHREIVLAGIGPGDEAYRTLEVCEAIRNCDVIFGASSVVSRLSDASAKIVEIYDGVRILDYLKEHPEFKRPVAVYSGDIAVSSGARKAAEVFKAAGYKVISMSGISSVALFANRLGVSLEDVRIISAHGRRCNVAGYVRKYEKLIVLPSGAEDAERIASELDPVIKVVAGCDLGSDKEMVICIRGGEAETGISKHDFQIPEGAKVILYIENSKALDSKVIPSLKDSDIIRGEVPMTKEEIRALSIRKLELTPNSTFYDVGAGTGSISLEAALLHPDIEVYSFEKEQAAVELLIQNKEKFGLSNMHIIKGQAPEALEGSPKPSHVFIGGSGKKLKEILEDVTRDNKGVKIVMNCVTLETLSEIINITKELNLGEVDIIQVAVTRYNKRGQYHLADALNPVYIVVIN